MGQEFQNLPKLFCTLYILMVNSETPHHRAHSVSFWVTSVQRNPVSLRRLDPSLPCGCISSPRGKQAHREGELRQLAFAARRSSEEGTRPRAQSILNHPTRFPESSSASHPSCCARTTPGDKPRVPDWGRRVRGASALRPQAADPQLNPYGQLPSLTGEQSPG